MQLNLAFSGTEFRVRPILKWAGGKTQLLPQYDQYFPTSFEKFYEPFVGGGSVYFHLLSQNGGLRARLSDNNRELIDCYQAVRDHLPLVLEYLWSHKRLHSNAYYYQVRSLEPWTLDLPERAARTIYLNRTCFNGLYRVNQEGKFNTPIGDYKNPPILDEQRLTSASRALQETELLALDFREFPEIPRRGILQ